MTKLKNSEIEVKFKIKDRKALAEKLANQGWQKKKTVFQRTFSPFRPDFSLAKEGIFMRTREEGKKSTFTVKVKKDDSKYFHREEYEVEISDARKVAEMLSVLGFSNQRIFEKYRQEWTLKGRNASIFFDTLPILGGFLEIEGTKQAIEKIIKELELEQEERIIVSYWTLYEKKTGSFKGNMVFRQKVKNNRQGVCS